MIGVHHVVADLQVAQAAEERAEPIARRAARASGAGRAAPRRRRRPSLPAGGSRARSRRRPARRRRRPNGTWYGSSASRTRACSAAGATTSSVSPRARAVSTSRGKRGSWLRKRSVEEAGSRDAVARRRQLEQADRGAADRAEHRVEVEHQLARLDRERALFASRQELGVERRRGVARLALERLGLDRDHQRRLDAVEEHARIARQERQQVLPPREGRALLEAGQPLRRLEPEPIAGEVGQAARRGGAPRRRRAGRDRAAGWSACSSWPELRWLTASKVRIESTVSPKRSSRSGSSQTRREDVEHAAANGELANARDQVGAVITLAHQMLDHLVDRMVLADAHAQHARLERGARRQPSLQRARRRHHRRARRAEDAVERRHLLRAHRERHLGLLVRRERGRREPHHLVATARQRRRRRRPLARLGLVRETTTSGRPSSAARVSSTQAAALAGRPVRIGALPGAPPARTASAQPLVERARRADATPGVEDLGQKECGARGNGEREPAVR